MDKYTGAVGRMAPSQPHVGAAVGSWTVWRGKQSAEHDRT